MGASVQPRFSSCSHNILLAIRDVVSIIYIHHFCTRTLQIKSGTLTQTVPLRLRQKINRWKCPTLDPFKRIKHHRSFLRMSIFEWISRMHMSYSDTNGESIYHRKLSWTIILVLRGSPCRYDAQSSSWPLRP